MGALATFGLIALIAALCNGQGEAIGKAIVGLIIVAIAVGLLALAYALGGWIGVVIFLLLAGIFGSS